METDQVFKEESKKANTDNSSNEPGSQKKNQTTIDETKGQLGASPKKVSNIHGKSSTQSNTLVDKQYFYEDEVFRIDKKGRVKFGLVVETSGFYSDEEDEEFEEPLFNGDLRVIWYPEGQDATVKENSVGLADRTLMPGDIVRRMVPGKFTQRGYCSNIRMWADVRVLGTKYVIKNVDAERLRLISTWQSDSAVCLDSWVGSTKEVEEKAILRTPSGCRIEISSNDFYAFKDVNSRYQHDVYEAQVFYPGNIIVGSLPPLQSLKILTPDIPLHTNKKGKPLSRKFTIESVYTDTVWVHWQCRALSEEADLEQVATMQPSSNVSGDNLKRLKRLNLFEACMLQINDRSYLTYSSEDTLMKKSEWYKEQSQRYKTILRQQRNERRSNDAVHSESYATSGHSTTQNTTSNQHHYEKSKKKVTLYLDNDRSSCKLKKLSSKYKEKAHKKAKVSRDQEENDDDDEWISEDEHVLMDKNNRTDELIQKAESSKSKLEQIVTCASSKSNPLSKEKMSNAVEEEIPDEAPSGNSPDVEDKIFTDNVQPSSEDNTTKPTSTCSSSSPHNSPKHYSSQQLKKQTRKSFRKPFTHETFTEFKPKEGDELVTELLLVYSTATVVWQDGTTEHNVPSTELYPIHHLDTHEFFPGDFVTSGKEEVDVSYRDYGVIQTVDHIGRIAHVKWFTTYTSTDEPQPTYKGDSEVSVYDLKDHPDFQYRPGTMVIRVANFVGEDAKCTAGQIIDNYVDGRVKVWWVDGHVSMCWPQDLFEVGQYDAAAEAWTQDSEDSWETESENSEYGGGVGTNNIQVSLAESQILTNIEKARVAISRLEEIFNINPNLQNPEVMKKLLNVYKSCRYMDRLLNTNFFHEDNFKGLIERVRKGGTQKMHERVQDQKNRLFSDTTVPPKSSNPNPNPTPISNQQIQCNAVVAVNLVQKNQLLHQPLEASASKEFSPRVIFNISSTQIKGSSSHSSPDVVTSSSALPSKRRSSPSICIQESQNNKQIEDLPTEEYTECIAENVKDEPKTDTIFISETEKVTVSEDAICENENITASKNNEYNAEKNELLNSVMFNIEKAYQKTTLLTTTIDSSSQDDSGNFSRNENDNGCSISSLDVTNADTNCSLIKVIENQQSVSNSSIELIEDGVPELVCVRLCSLLKDQMVQFIKLIKEKYFKDDYPTLSNVFNSPVVEIEDVTIEATGQIEEIDDSKEEFAMTVLPAEETIQSLSTPEVSGNTTNLPINLLSEASSSTYTVPSECFQILSTAPKDHKYHLTIFHPNNTQQYYKAVQREHRMLKSSLPPGVWVRGFEDRMDLMSVMIEGPEKTPYEDGIFLFDLQLGSEYPKSPPLCHYISYCSDRLNPNLYEDGKVCVSLLGTWSGRDTETWGSNSTILQVIVSIQGLILVDEPYFNEAGYEKQKDTQHGKENSRMYNEMVIIKLIQASTKLLQNRPEVFEEEILNHFKKRGLKMYERIKNWMEYSLKAKTEKVEGASESAEAIEPVSTNLPEFPLVPASRGFCLSLDGLLENFKQKLNSLNNIEPADANPSE
uniref:UBIQUITIN_CONJUGAT_2 domain-containing protein n=1 Tax=Glossina brevipalpis TaxID=37001 RepID=A0A1A9WYQ4_9MUSC